MDTKRNGGRLRSLLVRVRSESEGGSPRLRSLLLVPLVVFYWGYLTDPAHTTIVSGINLVMHEGGHLFFMWFGRDVLTVAGGTIFQIVIPALVACLFFRQQDHFGVAVALFWAGLSLAEVAPYVADARSQLLPLVSPFPGAPVHDWYFLLGRAGLLAQDQLVAKAFHQAGMLLMTLGLGSGIWILRCMGPLRDPPEPGATPRPPSHRRQEAGRVRSISG